MCHALPFSRIDANNDYVPSGGNVRIFHQPLKMSNVASRVGSLDNATHQPGKQQAVFFCCSCQKNTQGLSPLILTSSGNCPASLLWCLKLTHLESFSGGGRVRIESRKINFKENAKPRIDAKAELPTDRPVKKVTAFD